MTRLTSSLHWLSTQTAYLKGRVKRLEAKLKLHGGKAKHYERRATLHREIIRTTNKDMKATKRKIASFAKAIDLHEVLTIIADIEPVQHQSFVRLTSHGGITRIIFAELRNSPTRSRFTSELGDALILAFGKSESPDDGKKDIRFRLLIRLHNLAYQQRVTKGREPKYSLDRRWFLP